MRKLFALVFLLALAGGGGYALMQGWVPGMSSDKHVLRRKSYRFLECLKFKEFVEAAAFHAPEELKKHPNIPKQLENFFKIPHETLDIQDIRIDFIEFDSTRQRAKVKTTTVVNILNKKETQRPEAMLYWKRVGDRWHLDLRTTLDRGAGI